MGLFSQSTKHNWYLTFFSLLKLKHSHELIFEVCPLITVSCPYYGTIRQNWICQLSVNRFYTDKNLDIKVDYGNNQTKLFSQTSNKSE